MWKTITETRPSNVIFILLVVPTALSSLLPSCCWASSSSASASSSPYVRFEPSRPRRSVHQPSMHRLPRSFGVAAFSSSSSSSSSSSLSSALSASSSLLAPSPSLPLLPPPSRRAFRSTAAAMTKLSHSSNRLRQDLRQAAEAEERESTAAGGIDDVHDAGEEDDPLKWEKLYYGGSNDNNNNNNNDNNNNNNNNGNKKSTMTSSASATSSSPIRVITFDLDNTLWKTTPTISHANDVLAEYLQTTLGFDKDTRVEHEMGRLFRQFPERYVGLSSPSSASSGEKPKEMEKEYERRSDKVVEEEESLARLVENVGQTPLSLSLNDRDDKVTNDHDTAENDNNGNGDGDGVHISSFKRNNAIQPSGAIKPVYLTLLRKDAIRSLILQKRPSLSPSSSSSDLSPTEIETIVDQAFRIWIDARIHSIQSNFAIHAVECLGRLRRDIPSIPTPSAPRQRPLPNLYVGAITDGNSDPTSVPPLRDMFDFVIRAEDVGTSKPDRRVYRAAVGELMVRLTRDGWGAETFFLGMDDDDDHDGTKMTAGIVDDAAKSWKDLDDDTLDAFSEAVGPWWVHVGDDFFKDVVAAKEFGMRSVWVRELIGGAGDTRGSGRGGGDDTDQANDDNTKKERTVQDLVEEISKKNGVVEMAIGESNFLMNALHEEFSDAILEKFEDLADLLIGWHTEGCIGGVGEVVDENMEKKEKNAPVDEPLPPPNVPPSVEGETQKKVDVKFCVFCGEKLPAVAKFCSGCGERQP